MIEKSLASAGLFFFESYLCKNDRTTHRGVFNQCVAWVYSRTLVALFGLGQKNGLE
jgi:hypothetical protein